MSNITNEGKRRYQLWMKDCLDKIKERCLTDHYWFSRKNYLRALSQVN